MDIYCQSVDGLSDEALDSTIAETPREMLFKRHVFPDGLPFFQKALLDVASEAYRNSMKDGYLDIGAAYRWLATNGLKYKFGTVGGQRFAKLNKYMKETLVCSTMAHFEHQIGINHILGFGY